MSERKVIQKWIPPDFDPSKVPRRKQQKDRQEVIRLMAPFSMRCNSCGEYVYAGKKFNGRKETVQGETYYGIKIFRFYIKCPQCSAEITFKTDPKNADYTVEHGVSRNFEPWREAREEDEDPDADPLAHHLEDEEKTDADIDPMKALEQRTMESKREMEIMDALQDIRTRNARMDRVDADVVLANLEGKGKAKEPSAEDLERIKQEKEDEELVRKHFGRDLTSTRNGSRSSSGSSNSPPTPAEAVESSTKGVSVKRARSPDKDGATDDREPDVAALLSDRAKAHLSGNKNVGLPSSTTKSMLSSKSSVAPPPIKKKRAQANAFGLLRKKA